MQCDVSICQNNGLGYCATHKLYSGCKTRTLKCVEMRRSDPCDTNNGSGIYDMGDGVYNENVPEIRLPHLPITILPFLQISEEDILRGFREMCIESLDPETFEKSEEVEYHLRKTRNLELFIVYNGCKYEIVDSCNFHIENNGSVCSNCHLSSECDSRLQDICGDTRVFRKI